MTTENYEALGRITSFVRELTNKMDTQGDLDGELISQLSSAIHHFSKNISKQARSEPIWKEVLKLLNGMDDAITAIKTSVDHQHTAWQKQMRAVQTQSRTHVMHAVNAAKMQNQAIGGKFQEEMGALRNEIAILNTEKEQLLTRLGFGQALGASLEEKVNDGSLAGAPLRETGDGELEGGGGGGGGTDTASLVDEASVRSRHPSAPEATIFECLRLHEEVIACRQKLAQHDLTEQGLREEVKQITQRLESEAKAHEDDVATLKGSMEASKMRLSEVTDKHHADLRRLSNEYVAQKAHFREVMNKFRSQVEAEMARQREEATQRIKRERETIATSAAMDNERASETLQAALARRVSDLQQRHQQEMAAARHMHRQELQRVLAENDRLRRALYHNLKGKAKGDPLGRSGGGRSVISGGASSSGLPWGSGHRVPKYEEELGLGLSPDAQQFARRLDELLHSLGPDGEVENLPLGNSRGSLASPVSGVSPDTSASAAGARRARRAPTPPLPSERGRGEDLDPSGASGGAAAAQGSGFILSSSSSARPSSSPTTDVPGVGSSSIASVKAKANEYRQQFEMRLAPSPGASALEESLRTAEGDVPKHPPAVVAARRAEERAVAAADEVSARYRIGQKTDEEAELEADLAQISRDSPAALARARAQAAAARAQGQDSDASTEHMGPKDREKARPQAGLSLQDLAGKVLRSPGEDGKEGVATAGPRQGSTHSHLGVGIGATLSASRGSAGLFTASRALTATARPEAAANPVPGSPKLRGAIETLAEEADAEADARKLLGHNSLLEETSFMEEWNDSFQAAMRLEGTRK